MKKVVVITGGSAGLGRAIAREFARQKCDIGLIARNEERLVATQKEIESLGGKALIFPMDVANPEQMKMAAQMFEEKLGPIDIWINNAMVSIFSPALEMKAADYQRVTDVTYLGYVYGTLEALKIMKPRDRGMIIQIGSALAYRAIPLQSAYSAAKHAVQGFTESVRSELIHDGSKVKISMVQLPALNTPHFQWVKNRLQHNPRPIPPIYQPEVVAKAVVWASQHYRREWYIGFMTTVAIIGDKIASSLGDRYLARHYKDQEGKDLADPKQSDNLYESVSGDFEARGKFDREASSYSFFILLNQYRFIVFLAGFIVLALLLIFVVND